MPIPNPDLSLQTCIQDPAWPDSSYLLEEILIASQGATSGAGAFAFASEAGIKLLFHDSDFQKFLSKYPFHLTIGVDAITDTKALKAISSCVAENQNLKARVFLGSGAWDHFSSEALLVQKQAASKGSSWIR